MRVSTPYEQKAFRLGARRERLLPVGAWRGRILIAATVTDNATTAANLLSSMYDRAILDVAGLSSATSNPKVVIRFERLGVALVSAGEDFADFGDLVKNLELTHTPAGGNTRTRRLQIHPFVTPLLRAQVAVGPLYANQVERPVTYRIPFSPVVVNAEVDTFELAPRTAVDTSANVTAHIYADVIIHSNAGWVREDPACDYADERPGVELADEARSNLIFDTPSSAGLAGQLALGAAGGQVQRARMPG